MLPSAGKYTPKMNIRLLSDLSSIPITRLESIWISFTVYTSDFFYQKCYTTVASMHKTLFAHYTTHLHLF